MLPANHPQRIRLNDEAHARTPEALRAPVRIFYLTLYPQVSSPAMDVKPVIALTQRFGVPPPQSDVNHFSADLGPFRVRWERHTEFNRFTFLAAGPIDLNDPFASTIGDLVPPDWLASLPGEIMVATHAVMVAGNSGTDLEGISDRVFSGNAMIGAEIGAGTAVALTDARIHDDGFSRLLVIDHGMAPHQAGRMVQRLLEIETYRMMALLALPIARELGPFLTDCEKELAAVMEAMVPSNEENEPMLLDRLTRLEAAIQSRHSSSRFRFSAAAAYYELVQRRISELGEKRLPGMQRFQEFSERRLAPAMNTCRSTSARQEALAIAVSRGSQLLSTRVDVTRERQNQAVLETMNRRARMQLRLQETVEGLSIAAVTYYCAGLVGYIAKGAQSAGMRIDPNVVTAVSIPIIALLVALGISQIRRRVTPTLRGWRFWK